MNIFRCTILSLLLIVAFNSKGLAQAEVDSAYIDYLNSSWDEVQATEYDDSIQSKYASEFYEYYLEHEETVAGKKALQSALMMWGNTGNAAIMDEAISKFKPDSDVWAWVPNSLGHAYVGDSSRTHQDAMKKLESLKDYVTNPVGKSAILTSLVRVYKRNPDTHQKALEYAQDLVEINESKWFVDLGLGAIYELESLGIGQAAPEFTATTYHGEEFNLADHKGKYIILDFWATWCGPCMPEIPVIKSLRETYPEEDLTILSIALEEDSEKYDKFLTENGMTWTQILQEKKREDEIPTLYNVGGIPQKYIIGPEGNIVAKHLRGERLTAKMDTLINRK
ncbi:MAG: TlpA family protein disulfide reductase [Gracilimonas sp.]|uniref:TlpA family protein disulfide reductase n=1 Tax=Gracilimonas sp. TaxID=1974203 RepID=UPI001B1912B8|nr:TlpA disulfide reductase family protein [Gracilimonas sp.]MBO6587031.1 TlpA family protein disulfide reductase [Gracilimonas sp.]MBO6614481.1 TlpA family protein disulfide reductase [Gracilimonas sp.]